MDMLCSFLTGMMEAREGVEDVRKRRHWGRKLAGALLAAYVLAVTLPYLFAPGMPDAAQAAAMTQETQAEGDRATLIPTGEQAMDVRLNLIANAQSSLVVGTYLYADDESGHTIAAALLDAADRGVQVRIITDGMVGMFNLLGSDLAYVLGAHPNIELRFYNPINPLRPWELSDRYHEKYVIADSRAFVLGGRNISDEFLTPEEHPSYNYDLDVMMWRESPAENSAAAALLAYVDRLWDSRCTTQYAAVPQHKQQAVDALRQELARRYERIAQERAQALAPADWEALTVPVEGYALLTNPTDAGVKRPELWASLIAMMNAAEERVWIQTPYLVLNGPMRDSLAQAAELPSEMTVLTNSRAGGNNIVASADAVFHRPMLTRMDYDLYEFQGGASMHTKAMLVDGDLSVFGSFNFDMRSAYSDTEVMLAVRSRELNRMAEEYMLGLRGQALPVQEDGSYGQSGGVTALETPFGKNLLILVASPFISLVRFMI